MGRSNVDTKLTLASGLLVVLMLPVLAQTMSKLPSSSPSAQGAISDPQPPATRLSVTGAAATTATGLPTRGMTMAQVEKSHGAPTARRAPVGDPPITRWEYSNFVVYFEYRHVIHSVTKRNL